MTHKGANQEKKNIEAYRARIIKLEKLLKDSCSDAVESVTTRINVLQYKINIAEECIDQSECKNNPRVFCRSSNGSFTQ